MKKIKHCSQQLKSSEDSIKQGNHMKYYTVFIMLCACNALIVSAGHNTALDHNLFTTIIFRGSFNYCLPPLPPPPCDNIQSLLELKANLNAQDKWGNKPLAYAKKFKDKELITLLCKYHSEINPIMQKTKKRKRKA